MSPYWWCRGFSQSFYSEITTSRTSGDEDKTERPIIEATNPSNTNTSRQIRETKTDIGHHNSNVSIISVLPFPPSLSLSYTNNNWGNSENLQYTEEVFPFTSELWNYNKRVTPLSHFEPKNGLTGIYEN